jgi:hypothetical protein
MRRVLEKIVDVKPDEIRAVVLGFIFNLPVLGGYYLIRPIRKSATSLHRLRSRQRLSRDLCG